MAVTSTPVFVQTPKVWTAQIGSASLTAAVTLVTAGANGSKVMGVVGQSTDSVSHDVQLAVTISGTSCPFGTITIPANAGNAGGTPSVNMFSVVGLPIDSDSNPHLLLTNASYSLTVFAVTTTVTAGKTINIIASGGDF